MGGMGDSIRTRREERSIARRARRADQLDAKWFGGPRPRQQLTGDLHEQADGCSWIGPLPTADEQASPRRRRA